MIPFDAVQSRPSFLVYFVTNARSYFIATLAGTTGLLRTGDIRYGAYFSNVGGDLALTKYKGKQALSDGNANSIAMKTGELYLIRAEAYARNNQDVFGMANLNTLKTSRVSTYTPQALTGIALLSAIADERRAEFIGEGHRFFDLKRTTCSIVRGSTCVATIISPSGSCTLPNSAREWTTLSLNL